MSAYVLDREHFVAIANFIRFCGPSGPIGQRWLHVYHPDVAAMKGGTYYLTAAEAANALLVGNLESVAFRYNEPLEGMPVITAKDMGPYSKMPKAVEMFGVLRSLQYQSCERNDYHQSLAYAVLIQVLWLAGEKAAEQAGAGTWA